MPTTLNSGLQLPDKGSVDWYSSMQSNYNLIDTHLGDTDVHVTAEDKANWNSKQGSLSQDQLDAIAQVATNTDDIATLQSGKANASHTHSSSDITDIEDYATKQYVDNSISGLVDNAPDALNTLNELSAALNDDSNFASTVTNALATKANSADLATVATSGDYNDLDNLPTIPTKTSDLSNDSDFVVSSNLATVATSGDYDDLSNKPSIPTNTSDLNNDSGFVTLNDFDIPSKTSDLTNDSGFITSSDVPTGTSDLINDSNFVDTSNAAVASGITAAKVTDYDTHIADTDIHVTASDKTTWNTVTSKAQDSDVMHLSGNESASGDKNFKGLLTTIPDGTIWPVTANTTDDITYLGANAIHVEQKGSGKLTDLSGGAWSVAELGVGCFFFRINNGADIRYKNFAQNTVNRIPVVSNANRFINDVTPNENNAYSLGTSSLRWSSCYSNAYYLGTTAFGDIVTHNASEFLTSHQSLSSCVKNVVTNSQTIKSTAITRGTAPSSAQTFGIAFSDNNNKYIGNIYGVFAPNMSTFVGLYAYKGSTTSNGDNASVRVGYDASGNVYTYAPTPATADNSTQIATTAFVKAQGYLGMPDLSNGIDISSYLDTSRSSINYYTPPVNGWISIKGRSSGASIGIAIIQGDFAQSSYNLIDFGSSDKLSFCALPVKASVQVEIWLKGITTLDFAKFYPCLGNV